MLSIQENELLTRVGPGTPMGELMRRYWHPIAASAELEATTARAADTARVASRIFLIVISCAFPKPTGESADRPNTDFREPDYFSEPVGRPTRFYA